MTRRPAAVLPDAKVKSRKRERAVRISTKRMAAVAQDAASITHLGLDMFTLVKLGYAGTAELYPAHLRRSENAMGILAVRLPRQVL
jgi:hypothetical protein